MIDLTPVRTAPYRALGWLGAGLTAVVAFDPAHTHVPLCPFHALTGWWCPLCGGLRSADALAHLRVLDAWRDNLLLVSALPVLVWFWLDWIVRSAHGQPRRSVAAPVTVALAVLAVSFTVVRNLPTAGGLRPI